MFFSPKSELFNLKVADSVHPIKTILLPSDFTILLLGANMICTNMDIINAHSISMLFYTKNSDLIFQTISSKPVPAAMALFTNFSTNCIDSVQEGPFLTSNLSYPIILKDGFIVVQWTTFFIGNSINDLSIYYMTL